MSPNQHESDDDLNELLRDACAASAPDDQFVARLHEQLLSELAESQGAVLCPLSGGPPSPPAPLPLSRARGVRRFTQWIGGLSMRQRLAAFGGVGVAALLGFVLIWGGSFANPASAMEKMAEKIRQVKSYKCAQVVQLRNDPPEPGKPPIPDASFTIYWLAPGSVRTEETFSAKWQGPGPQRTKISPAGKPHVLIDHMSKTFTALRGSQLG